MADLLQRVDGVLVGAEARAYQGFIDREGAERPGGVTRRLFVSQGFTAAPVEVKVPPSHQAAWDTLVGLGAGAVVSLVCQVRARNNALALTLAEVAGASPPNGGRPAQAPAPAKA